MSIDNRCNQGGTKDTRPERPEEISVCSMRLLPCPFCGGGPTHYPIEAHKHKGALACFMPDHEGSYWIECPKCDYHMGDKTFKAIAERWNRRAG